jgi:AcrR family transcriptional regulator
MTASNNGRASQPLAEPLDSPPAPSRGHYTSETHRVRILSATSRLVCQSGIQSVTVSRIVSLAGVSRRTFYLLFENRDHCLRVVLEEAVTQLAQRIEPAYRSRVRWVDGVRAALLALLELFDQEPELARLCVLEAPAAPPAALAGRGKVLAHLTTALDEGREQARAARAPSPLVAEMLVGGALAVVHARLLERRPEPLVELLNPLMAMIVLPYLGSSAARRELSREAPPRPPVTAKRSAAPNPLRGLNMRLTYRTMRVMAAVSAQPGLSNAEVAQRAGISDQGQISKLLARLAGLGLLQNTGAGQSRGAANAWQLTARGRQVEWAFAREAGAAGQWWRAG